MAKFAKQAGNHVRVDMLRSFVINQIAATSAAPPAPTQTSTLLLMGVGV